MRWGGVPFNKAVQEFVHQLYHHGAPGGARFRPSTVSPVGNHFRTWGASGGSDPFRSHLVSSKSVVTGFILDVFDQFFVETHGGSGGIRGYPGGVLRSPPGRYQYVGDILSPQAPALMMPATAMNLPKTVRFLTKRMMSL